MNSIMGGWSSMAMIPVSGQNLAKQPEVVGSTLKLYKLLMKIPLHPPFKKKLIDNNVNTNKIHQ